MNPLLFLLLIPLALTGCQSTSRLNAVSNFNLERYLGTWYEVARYDHRFERGMNAVSARYSMNTDGTIQVINRGHKDGAWNEIQGVAKPKSDADRGWLKVSFFKPFYASYKILYLDPEYTHAIVTSSTYGYLWILARAPHLSATEQEQLLAQAEGFGFDRNKMIFVDQSRNRR